MDADERLTPALADEIQQLLADNTPYETYCIPRRTYLGDRWIRYGGWYPSAQMKLYKRSVLRWEETTVHPRALSDRAWGSLQHDLIHLSYRDTEDFLAKLDRQTSLEAQKWAAARRNMGLGKALWRTADRVVRSYVFKQGFRDGQLGWFMARMGGRYQWLSYTKYLKLKRQGCAREEPRA